MYAKGELQGSRKKQLQKETIYSRSVIHMKTHLVFKRLYAEEIQMELWEGILRTAGGGMG